MFDLFESTIRRKRDLMALKSMYVRYGDEFVDILERRANNDKLDRRSQRHWKRLNRKAHKHMDEILRS